MREQGGIFLFKKNVIFTDSFGRLPCRGTLSPGGHIEIQMFLERFQAKYVCSCRYYPEYALHSRKYRRGGHGGFWI